MKTSVIFAGPSIYGLDPACLSGMRLCAPACAGDIFSAVQQGARQIGLIDGLYGDCASVWHKEILYALEKGVRVFGGASMGALRAAECAAFGMIGIGRIFEDYHQGRRVRDADIAVFHAPAALDFKPLTLSLVDFEASLEEWQQNPALYADMHAMLGAHWQAIAQAGEDLHFTKRTWRRILRHAGLSVAADDGFLQLLQARSVSQKQADACAVLAVCQKHVDVQVESRDWKLQNTLFFEQIRQFPGVVLQP